jgi:hypothetical protein
MRNAGAWAMCAMLMLGCTGCSWISRIPYIPWIGERKSCDLNTYRVPAVSSRNQTDVDAIRGNGPAADVPETDFDFGKVSEGKLLVHDFRVRNLGKSVLRIKKVLPS